MQNNIKLNAIKILFLAVLVLDHGVRAQELEEFSAQNTLPESVVWFPALSFLLPGLHQWWFQDYNSALAYTGTATLGLGLIIGSSDVNEEGRDISEVDHLSELTSKEKWQIYGAQLYSTAGSLSAYEGFRAAAEQHPRRFSFLPEDEHINQVLQAPFEFSFVKRWTTWVPLSILIAGAGSYLVDRGWYGITPGNELFALGVSYNAGVSEEALFRGWMMPVLYDWTGSLFWSNAINSTVFALGHLSPSNPRPLVQLLMGYYWSSLTQTNGWRISESVFIHTWWDVIAINMDFLAHPKSGAFLLPPLLWHF